MAKFDFNRLADIEKIAGDRLDDVVSGTLLDLSRRVVLRTPVGNPSLWKDPPPPGYTGGQAKGNWQASLNQPTTTELERIDKTGSSTIADILPMTEAAPGNVWYLTNNLPYINRLEFDGWSTQSPEGMVRVTLAELDTIIDERIAELPK